MGLSVEGHEHWATADTQILAPGLTLKSDLQDFRGVILRTTPQPEWEVQRFSLFPVCLWFSPLPSSLW